MKLSPRRPALLSISVTAKLFSDIIFVRETLRVMQIDGFSRLASLFAIFNFPNVHATRSTRLRPIFSIPDYWKSIEFDEGEN